MVLAPSLQYSNDIFLIVGELIINFFQSFPRRINSKRENGTNDVMNSLETF